MRVFQRIKTILFGLAEKAYSSFLQPWMFSSGLILGMAQSAAVSAQLSKFYIGSEQGPGSPSTFVQVGEVKTINREGADRPDIDVSHLESTRREYRQGLPDSGSFTIEMNWIASNTGQIRLQTAEGEDSPSEFKVTYPNSKTSYFQGFVKSVNGPNAAVDGTLMLTANIRITGAVTTV